METNSVSLTDMQRIMSDFIRVVVQHPDHPRFSQGEREEFQKILNAIERMQELRGLN